MKRILELEVREFDKSGSLKATYLQSSGPKSPAGIAVKLPKAKALWRRSLDIFLPDGYPASVSEDYTRYQIYDSLQAFACTIAGIISSRAVWEGLGVGDPTQKAIYAMLTQVARESTGKLTTISSAWWFGPAVESECKSFRLASDFLCDGAMMLDMLCPLVSCKTRIVLLCFSSALYAVAGTLGGASKSSLSGHFAKWNNLGELNAKESSQETFLSLIGMGAATILCGYVHTQACAQVWLVLFLALHLFLNWMAVRSVDLRSLNRQRANMVFSNLEQNDTVLNPREVSDQERIFESRGGSVFRWVGKDIVGSCDFGMPLSKLIGCVTNRRVSVKPKSPFLGNCSLSQLMELFQDEQYLLYYSVPEPLLGVRPAGRVTVVVVLKDGVTPQNQLKAWLHGLVLAKRLAEQQGSDAPILSQKNFNKKQRANISHVASTLRYVNGIFDSYVSRITAEGWDCNIPVLETQSGSRIVCYPQDC